MRKTIKLLTCPVVVAALALICTGCKVLLPAHPNSNERAGETVSIQMLNFARISAYSNQYNAAFPLSPLPTHAPDQKALPLVAAAGASAIAGYAVDYVQKELKAEAALYEAQFGTTVAWDRFWAFGTNSMNWTVTQRTSQKEERRSVGGTNEPLVVVTNSVVETQETVTGGYVQRYYGLQVIRTVKNAEVFNLVCGIAPSADGQLLRIAPLYFVTKKTKAKILGDQWWSYLPLWWLQKFLKTDGHHVDTTVQLDIDGYWRDRDQQLKVTKIAAIPLNFSGYDIGTPKPLTVTGEWFESGKTNKSGELINLAGGEVPGGASGWLLSVPISVDAGGKPVASAAAGAFTVKATVTEKDPSNAKQELEKAATLVGEQKEKIQTWITK